MNQTLNHPTHLLLVDDDPTTLYLLAWIMEQQFEGEIELTRDYSRGGCFILETTA